MEIVMKKIISGGQTGADQAGWRAAKRCGLLTGGWMPSRFQTEDGRHPEFAAMYGARVWDGGTESYSERTRRNVREADFTLWFTMGGETDSPGYWCTRKAAKESKKAWLTITETYPHWRLAELLSHTSHEVINIAGSRESRSPGIGAWVEEYLMSVFTEMKR